MLGLETKLKYASNELLLSWPILFHSRLQATTRVLIYELSKSLRTCIIQRAPTIPTIITSWLHSMTQLQVTLHVGLISDGSRLNRFHLDFSPDISIGLSISMMAPKRKFLERVSCKFYGNLCPSFSCTEIGTFLSFPFSLLILLLELNPNSLTWMDFQFYLFSLVHSMHSNATSHATLYGFVPADYARDVKYLTSLNAHTFHQASIQLSSLTQ
jgi:hypothetical protein